MPGTSKIRKAPKSKSLTEAEIVARVKKAEKGTKIGYNEFVKITENWKGGDINDLKVIKQRIKEPRISFEVVKEKYLK